MFGIVKKKAPGTNQRLNSFQYTFLVSSFETFINVILEYLNDRLPNPFCTFQTMKSLHICISSLKEVSLLGKA